MKGIKYTTAALGALILINFWNYSLAQNSDFKVDFSNKIKSQTTSAIIDSSEKKKLALKWINFISQLEKIKISEIHNYEIISSDYDNDTLSVKARVIINNSKSAEIHQLFSQFISININQLQDKSLEYHRFENLPRDSTEAKLLAGYIGSIFGNKFGSANINISALDENSKNILSLSFPSDATSKLSSHIKDILFNGSSKNSAIDFYIKTNISKQDALRIKSLKFEITEKPIVAKTVRYVIDQWEGKTSIAPLLQSLNSSNPIEEYEIARENLASNLIQISNEYSKLTFNQKDNSFLIYFLAYYTYRANVADHAVIYSFSENINKLNNAVVAGDHTSIFTLETLDNINSGKLKFSKKYKSSTQTGCTKYIPSDYQYNSKQASQGANIDNEISSFFSQLGLLNNTAVLGSPDRKIRVIVGPIEILTENGGVVRNTGKYQDEKPIVYSKSSKSIILNPEKISVGTSIVRIVGTYDDNSKVQLSNRLGGKRVVDAANISVICMEPLYTDNDLIKMMFGN